MRGQPLSSDDPFSTKQVVNSTSMVPSVWALKSGSAVRPETRREPGDLGSTLGTSRLL